MALIIRKLQSEAKVKPRVTNFVSSKKTRILNRAAAGKYVLSDKKKNGRYDLRHRKITSLEILSQTFRHKSQPPKNVNA